MLTWPERSLQKFTQLGVKTTHCRTITQGHATLASGHMPGKSGNRTSPVLGLHISGMRVNQDLPRRCTASSVSSWIGTYIALELKSKPLCPSGTEGWLRSCPLGSTQFVDARWRHESRAAPAC